jgi:hypothetical protein
MEFCSKNIPCLVSKDRQPRDRDDASRLTLARVKFTLSIKRAVEN